MTIQPRPSDELIEQALEVVADMFQANERPDEWALDVLRAACRWPDIMGAKEARTALGIAGSGNFTPEKVPGLPKPRTQLAATGVWDAGDILPLVREKRAKERSDGDKR